MKVILSSLFLLLQFSFTLLFTILLHFLLSLDFSFNFLLLLQFSFESCLKHIFFFIKIKVKFKRNILKPFPSYQLHLALFYRAHLVLSFECLPIVFVVFQVLLVPYHSFLFVCLQRMLKKSS